jgi:hypothetical protein
MASFEDGYPHHQTYYVENRSASAKREADAIPVELRGARAAQLARLVSGEIPDMLVWVNKYGPNGGSTH